MGGLVSSSIENKMSNSMEKNLENSLLKQRALQLKLREIQLATQFAIGKDRFYFFSVFYFVAFLGLNTIALKTKKPQVIVPLVPLSFIWAYQFDMYYLNKMKRIQKEASRLLKDEPELFYIPEYNNLISLDNYKKEVTNK